MPEETIIIIIITLFKCLMYLALTGGRLTSWLFTQHGRGVELGTTENKSR